MQLDSPSATSNCAAATATATEVSQFTSGSRSIPSTPRSTPPPPGGGASSTTPNGQQRIRQRGFPLEHHSAPTDDRGFPLLEESVFHDEYVNAEQFGPNTTALSPNNQRAMRSNGNDTDGGGGGYNGSVSGGAAATTTTAPGRGQIHSQSQRRLLSQSLRLPSSPPSHSPGLAPRKNRNLFLSPFSSTLPPEKATLADTTTTFDGNRTSWVAPVAPGGGGGNNRGGQGQQGSERPEAEGGVRGRWGGGWVGGDGRDPVGQESPPSPLSPTRRTKGSHAKLDLLLCEMQRLNGRLDTIVGRLGALEEWRAETVVGAVEMS